MIGRRASVLMAIASMACATAPPPQPAAAPPPKPAAKPAPVRIADANAAFGRGDYAAAVRAYDAVLDRTPDNGTALYNKGLALQHAGDLAAAHAAYEGALGVDPTDVEAALNLGAVKKEMGDLDGAVALYRRFLKVDPFNARLLNNLAALYRAQGQHKRAVRAVRKLLMRDKDNVDAYKNLALIYFDQEKFTLARTILDNALSMSKAQGRQEPDIYVNLGRIFVAEDDNGRAMAMFKRAVELDAGHAVASYNIGALALGHRDYQTAARAYEVCAKAWPEKHDVWASLGYAYQGLQAFAKAEQHLAKSRGLLRRAAAAAADASLEKRLARDEEQLLVQLVRTAQGAQQTQKALDYAREYMQLKGLECREDDVDGFCGRYNGIKLTLELEREASQAPDPVSAPPDLDGGNG